jgi:uncharacterized membrane-anchored protein
MTTPRLKPSPSASVARSPAAGDLLSQAREYGGLGFGTASTSLVFFAVIVALVTSPGEGEGGQDRAEDDDAEIEAEPQRLRGQVARGRAEREFAAALAAVFALWYATERTLSIHAIVTRRREAFY